MSSICSLFKKINDIYSSNQNVDYSSDVIKSYLRIIENNAPLKPITEKNLSFLYKKNHDMNARDDLIKHSFWMCLNISKKLAGNGVDIEDLFEEANVMLIKSVDSYNYNDYHSFTSYAYSNIFNHLFIKYYSNFNQTYLPINDLKKFLNYIKAKYELEEKYNKILSIKEIASYININVKDAYMYNSLISPSISISSIKNDIIDYDNCCLNDHINSSILKYYLNQLPIYYKSTILIRYGFYDGSYHTLEQTSDILYFLGITKTRVTKARIAEIERISFERLKKIGLEDSIDVVNNYYKQFKIKR